MRLFLCLTILISLVSAPAEPRLQASSHLSSADLAIPKPNLRRMIRDSGRIFAGTVIKVERANPSPDSSIATTQIRRLKSYFAWTSRFGECGEDKSSKYTSGPDCGRPESATEWENGYSSSYIRKASWG